MLPDDEISHLDFCPSLTDIYIYIFLFPLDAAGLLRTSDIDSCTGTGLLAKIQGSETFRILVKLDWTSVVTFEI